MRKNINYIFNLNKVFLPLNKEIRDSILSGENKLITYNSKLNEQIGMFVGETAVTDIDNKIFLVTNKGLFNDNNKLYLYELRNVEEII